MEKIKSIVGGFVGINEGTITNCYTAMKINSKYKTAEFCSRNEGKISQCFSNNSGKNKIKRFCLKNNGILEDYFFGERGKFVSPIDQNFNLERLVQNPNWNFENVWTVRKGNSLGFRRETYFEEFRVSKNIVIIKSAKELIEFAKKVNSGNEECKNANVSLQRNIDLKGKRWIPIGKDKYNSFNGTFNGNGFSIRNFKIYQDNLEYVGFFGYLQNATVCNLKLDCICKGKRCVGALAGINDGGHISCCRVITNIQIGETTGGLVGKNTGKITKCCVIGKFVSSAILLPLIRNLILGILLIVLIIMLVNKYYQEKVYVPVAIDPNVIKSTMVEEEFTGSATDNKASFDFSQTIIVDSSNMIGMLDFRNPKRGNHNIVVKVLISDKELKEKLGTTGRSIERQAFIESEEGYNSENYMTEIYKSGLIERGYALPKIQISDLEDGTKLSSGTYSATVSLEFYKIETNEKAIVNTKLPVTIVVK